MVEATTTSDTLCLMDGMRANNPSHFLASNLEGAIVGFIVKYARTNLFFDAVVAYSLNDTSWQVEVGSAPML